MQMLLEYEVSVLNPITHVMTKPVYALADTLGIAGFFMSKIYDCI
jgi:hypothetical protein